MRKNEVKSKCKINKIDVTDDTFISQTSVLTGWQKRDVVIRKIFKQGGNLLNLFFLVIFEIITRFTGKEYIIAGILLVIRWIARL